MIWARRQLALIVAQRGGHANLQAAMKLIEQNLAPGDPSAEDLRTLATFLSFDPRREKKQEAVKVMLSLINREELSLPEDRFKLAELCRLLGDMPRYREQMRAVLAKSGNEPRYLAAYVSTLLQQNDSDAEIWLQKLEQAAPDNFGTARLRAESLLRRNRVDEACDALKKAVQNPACRRPTSPGDSTWRRLHEEQFAGQLRQSQQIVLADRCLEQAEAMFRCARLVPSTAGAGQL